MGPLLPALLGMGADEPTPLASASSSGDLAEVRRLLAEGVDVRAVNAFGETALHISAIGGSDDVLAALLEVVSPCLFPPVVRRR